jgi:hypothetical protein
MALPQKEACRIVQLRQGDIEEQESWPELLAWCLERAEAFHKTFNPRVQALDLEGQAEEEEPEVASVASTEPV